MKMSILSFIFYLILGGTAFALGIGNEQVWAKERQLLERYNKYPADVEVNYQLGLVYFRLAEYGKAEEFFQRTIALYPAHVGALLDMAIIYINDGRYEDAERMFVRIDSIATPPEDLKEVLEGYRRELKIKAGGWRYSHAVTQAIGWADNVNDGLRDLTVKIGSTVKVLTDDNLAKSSSYFEYTFDTKAMRVIDADRWLLSGLVKDRVWVESAAYRQQLLQLGAMRMADSGSSGWDAYLYLVATSLGLRSSQRVAVWGADWRPGLWSGRLGFHVGGLAQMQLPTERSSGVKSRQAELRLSWDEVVAGAEDWQLRMAAELALDEVSGVRAGGDVRRGQLEFGATKRLSQVEAIYINAMLQREIQSEPFGADSPIRTSLRGELDLRYEKSLSREWKLECSYGWRRQWSNIDLFKLSRQEVRIGARYTF